MTITGFPHVQGYCAPDILSIYRFCNFFRANIIPVIVQYTSKGGGTALVIELGEKWNLLY